MSSLHKILDSNISLTHEQCEETNGHTRDNTKNYPIYELIEFIPLDGQAKENSKHAAERSSRLLQVELVLIVGWLRCVAFAEVFAAVNYQPADDIVKKIMYFLAISVKVLLIKISAKVDHFKSKYVPLILYIIIYRQSFDNRKPFQ